MIVTEFYRGQGLGNQLWVYAVLRTVALDRGLAFGIQAPQRFKGRAFMRLDYGRPVAGPQHTGPSPDLPPGMSTYYTQTRARHPETGADISPVDPGLLDVADGTKIDGNFESEDYILHRRAEILGWFASTLDIRVPKDICAISLRGGEYRYHSDLLLPQQYYATAMDIVRDRHPGVQFVVVTDDPGLASRILPGLRVVSHRRLPDLRRFGVQPSSKAIGGDFTWLQRASHLILSNSSFSWWGAWTNATVGTVVAPRYWARHNVSDGYWSTGTALTRGWLWLDRDGHLSDYDACAREWEAYRSSRGWSPR